MICKLFVIVASFSLCKAAFVDILHKCSEHDEDCLKKLVENAIQEISKNGIKEHEVEPVNNLIIKDINISAMNVANITFVEASIKGLENCAVTRFALRVGKGKNTMNIVCDINVYGKYKMSGVSPAIQKLFGSDYIHGEGNYDINISKLNLTLNFYFYLVKNADGDIFFEFHNDKFRYKYNGGDGKIKIDNVFLGDQDASEIINTVVNQNWPLMTKTFGNQILDAAVNIVNDIVGSFFKNFATKYYIIEDLSPYVKNG